MKPERKPQQPPTQSANTRALIVLSAPIQSAQFTLDFQSAPVVPELLTKDFEVNIPGGRPSIYTEELASRICERLATGESLRKICEDPEMPARSTVRAWALDNKAFSDQYARAREIGWTDIAEDLLDIADDQQGDPSRDRLRVDTRKWLLSKMLPKVYGEKTTTEVSGPNGGPVQISRIELVALK